MNVSGTVVRLGFGKERDSLAGQSLNAKGLIIAVVILIHHLHVRFLTRSASFDEREDNSAYDSANYKNESYFSKCGPAEETVYRLRGGRCRLGVYSGLLNDILDLFGCSVNHLFNECFGRCLADVYISSGLYLILDGLCSLRGLRLYVPNSCFSC